MQKVSSQQGLKFINQQKVLNLIYNESPISRVEIAERTSLTQQSVTNIVNRLMEEDLVREGESMSGNKGRKPIPLAIQADKMYAIGIEVAVKYISGKLINFHDKVIEESRIDVNVFETGEDTLDCIRSIVKHLLKQVSKKRYLKGMGISIQGLVDSEKGVVIHSPGLAWKGYPLVEKLQHEFDFPIYIENDVNLLAIIENQSGSLENSLHNVVLKLDHGIGGAITVDKKLVVGSSNVAGEFGHIKAFHGSNAYKCHCGAVGCITTLASNSGLILNKNMTLEEFNNEVREEDLEAQQLFANITDALGLALSNTITFINPDKILLTGQLIHRFGDILVPKLKQIVEKTVPEVCRDVSIDYLDMPLDESILAAKLVTKYFFDVPIEILSL